MGWQCAGRSPLWGSSWTRRAPLALLLLAVLLPVCVSVTACERTPRPRAPGRVLLIGIDGASPHLIEPWIEEGLLPNLAEIARVGASGPIRSHVPLLSPRIWTSIATGKAPEAHGVAGWVQGNADGSVRLFKSFDRRGHALWNIASEVGLKVGVVNWLTTFPPEKIRGVMVTDFAIPGEREGWETLGSSWAEMIRAGAPFQRTPNDPDLATVWPPGWRAEFERLASDGGSIDGVDDPAAELEGTFHQIVSRALGADLVSARTALAVDAELEPDLLMVFLPGIDRVSHFFWGGTEAPGTYKGVFYVTNEWRQNALASMRAYYRFTDQLIGALAKSFGPDDLVLVVSDHGFEPQLKRPEGGGMKTGTHIGEDAIEGVVFARGRGVRPGPIYDMSVNDVTPTILAWLGLPVADDMDGRVADFVTATAGETIATWDTGRIERIATSEGQKVEESIVEELRALGYVE